VLGFAYSTNSGKYFDGEIGFHFVLIFLSGHERPDVVEARVSFLAEKLQDDLKTVRSLPTDPAQLGILCDAQVFDSTFFISILFVRLFFR
jgi:hypothetical protein